MNTNRCWFCGSHDTDKPYTKPSEIAFLSRLVPRLCRRFCRACGRHFWVIQAEHRARSRNEIHNRDEAGRDDIAQWYSAAAPVAGARPGERSRRERVRSRA